MTSTLPSRHLTGRDVLRAVLDATNRRVELHHDSARDVADLLNHGTDGGNFFDDFHTFAADPERYESVAPAAGGDMVEATLWATDGRVRLNDTQATAAAVLLARSVAAR